MASPEKNGLGKKFSVFIFGGGHPVISEERLQEMKKEQQQKDENLMIDFITKGKSLASFNPKRIELLNIVRGSCEFFLMVLSLYCITASPFFLIYELEKSSPLFKYSVGFASGIIAFFNVFRNIISEEIDKEFGLSPMTDRKLTVNLKHQFRQNLIHTILIMIFPLDLYKSIPPIIYSSENTFVLWEYIPHIIQLNKMYFIITYFLGNTRFYSESAYRICNMYGCFRDWQFVLKCQVKEKPILLLSCMFCLVLYTFSLSFYVTDNSMATVINQNPGKYIDKDPNLSTISINIDTFYTAIWNVVVTVTTVGYGDVVMKGKISRLICALAALTGSAVTSILISNLTEQLTLKGQEGMAYEVICKTILYAQVETDAASLFTLLKKLMQLNKKTKQIPTRELDKLKEELISKPLQKFRDSKREYRVFEINSGHMDMEREFERCKKEITEVKILAMAILQKLTQEGIFGDDRSDAHRHKKKSRNPSKQKSSILDSAQLELLNRVQDEEKPWMREHMASVDKVDF